MRWKLKNEVQYSKWMYFPSLVDCITARLLWNSIQSRSGRTRETKFTRLICWQHEKAVFMPSCLTSCCDNERFFRPSILCGPGYVKSHSRNIEPNSKQGFLPKWHWWSHWDKTVKGIKDSFFLLLFYKEHNLNLLSWSSKNMSYLY